MRSRSLRTHIHRILDLQRHCRRLARLSRSASRNRKIGWRQGKKRGTYQGLSSETTTKSFVSVHSFCSPPHFSCPVAPREETDTGRKEKTSSAPDGPARNSSLDFDPQRRPKRPSENRFKCWRRVTTDDRFWRSPLRLRQLKRHLQRRWPRGCPWLS